jgi:hypothetical protein
MRKTAAALVPAVAMVAYAEDARKSMQAEFDELAARATAAIDTVNSMEDRARADGFSLHPDLIAQRSLVQSSMNSAEEALREKDFSRLRERLKRARGHIDRLYKML